MLTVETIVRSWLKRQKRLKSFSLDHQELGPGVLHRPCGDCTTAITYGFVGDQINLRLSTCSCADCKLSILFPGDPDFFGLLRNGLISRIKHNSIPVAHVVANESVQAKIDSLPDGGDIHVGPGTYVVNQTIHVPMGINIIAVDSTFIGNKFSGALFSL